MSADSNATGDWTVLDMKQHWKTISPPMEKSGEKSHNGAKVTILKYAAVSPPEQSWQIKVKTL
jgi:hypothetical protein